ncbi:helix-turn-helix domain-containing protein [Dictyobacter arantiisoli]|uniref:Transcriptional regulator n=1 Tax=Dictyobacter arantiisoli TaxID=2014874 RepID=A0A5A5T577_9CHLR|nr:helix-turn-helix domain-containing protein [Dictyobacter arantiisoli]GCF06437.1 transcriptional regulator [Dictyobacter arantiisoli]
MLDKTHEISPFAQLVTYYRQRRGISQGQLAQATRLSRTYVYHLETGQRANPSPQVVQNIARVLELSTGDRVSFFEAYNRQTGQFVDTDQMESTLLDLGALARLLVLNTSYPAHSLDNLWFLHSWNEASIYLFEVQKVLENHEHIHLLELVFDPEMRKRFHGWENLARRLVSDFLYNTRTLTHLSEYKALIKTLRDYPEYRRIASSVYTRSKPAPSFVFQIQHDDLGRITLRTATTVFTNLSNYSMVSYVPGDQQTLDVYCAQGWQPGNHFLH